MKLFVPLLAALALCAAKSVPGVPGDNSNYKQGDRYIWFPDGHGVPRLADLEAFDDEVTLRQLSRNAADGTKYFLFTRSNPTVPDQLFYGDSNSVLQSNFNIHRPTKFIVHGWNGDANSDLNPLITSSFLAAHDVNAIVVDWGHLANGLYTTATISIRSLGLDLGEFLKFINLLGVPFSNMHLVGFSLGAHLVGVAGRAVGGQVGRITGLEAAGPGFGSSNSNTMRSNDAIYTEGMHTESTLLGMLEPVGDVSFYPNGGTSQPGCLLSTCSHSRSWDLYASTVLYNHLWGRECDSVSQAMAGACSGVTFPMGNGIITKSGKGIFHVSTTSRWPY